MNKGSGRDVRKPLGGPPWCDGNIRRPQYDYYYLLYSLLLGGVRLRKPCDHDFCGRFGVNACLPVQLSKGCATQSTQDQSRHRVLLLHPQPPRFSSL